MAGIYIHIPFCKVKCNYCDFHFSIQHKNIDVVMAAMCKEIDLQKGYLGNETIETIYFGGGTPSIISKNHFQEIIQKIRQNFTVSPNLEFTVECNPDDLTREKLMELKSLGVNRLSIGIQSFDNDQLVFLNRAHNANEAENSVSMAKEIGFDNLTIDLIYGMPNTDDAYWKRQVEMAMTLDVPHISAYCLTFEEKTVFGNWLKKGKIKALSDESNLNQFTILQDILKEHDFEQYEISNFSKSKYISKHNSAYWLGKKYLGIGPSAHSYNGKTRQWNIANNTKYYQNIKNNIIHYEVENLSKENVFNEHIMTRLRTKWGVDLDMLNANFPKYLISIKPIISKFIQNKKLIEQDGKLYLTESGKFIVDHITSELFIT